MDFLGPLASGVSLLVVADLCSGYFEVEAMWSITADKLLAKLKPMFVRFGLPNSVLTDNGRAYKDKDFNNFGKFRHLPPFFNTILGLNKWGHRIPKQELNEAFTISCSLWERLVGQNCYLFCKL
jgi:hypothetical protein